MHRTSRLTSAIELLGVLIAAPFLLFPSQYWPATISALACSAFLLTRQLVFGLPQGRIAVVVISLVWVATCSLFRTYDLAVSIDKVCGVVLGATLFFALTKWANTEARRRVLLQCYAICGGVFALIALVGTSWSNKSSILGTWASSIPGSLRGIPGAEDGFNPNAVGGTLLLVIPIQLALLYETNMFRDTEALNDRPWLSSGLRLATWASAAASMLAFLLCQSRSAAVGLGVGGLTVIVATATKRRAWLPIVAAMVVSMCMVLYVVVNPVVTWTQMGGRPGEIEVTRVEIWSSAVSAIWGNPMGLGMNVFRKILPVRYPTAHSGLDTDVAHAHNHLLQAALDLGVVGLIVYSALWIEALRAAARLCRAAGNSAIAPAMLAGLLAYFIFNSVDTIPLGAKAGNVLWVFLALVVSESRRPDQVVNTGT